MKPIPLKGITTITNVKVSEVMTEFTFQNGETLNLTSDHDQDCCENVYADFSILELHIKQFLNQPLDSIEIIGVKDTGFLIAFKNGEQNIDKVLIGCHNIQNGYYSDNLELIINKNGTVERIDISEFTQYKDN